MGRSAPTPDVVWRVGTAVALGWGLFQAIRMQWLCDDAYIVLRYAKNFADGFGLVYNAGERVEGFTDLAWVIWTSLAFRLGVIPETWMRVSSIGCYAGAIVLLAWQSLRRRRALGLESPALPVAALLAGFHFDWNIFATSGLETSALTFLLIAGYVAAVRGAGGTGATALSAALLALAALTRPDAVLPALVIGAYCVATGPHRIRTALVYGSVFLALWGPVQLWRLTYYGDFFPNTYYAKSAMLPWWSQGWSYTAFYFKRYWFFLAALPALVAGGIRVARLEPGPRSRYREIWLPEVLLAATLAVTYSSYVARVGGDFMYARMLIPATPFYALLLELGVVGLAGWLSSQFRFLMLLFGLWVFVRAPRPYSRHGIGDEWATYHGSRERSGTYLGRVLRPYFEGLPVRILIFGMQARMAYRSEAAYVLEGYGLTDRFVARLPLTTRGWVGHEKVVPTLYALEEQRVHFMFHPTLFHERRFEDFVPRVPVQFGDVSGYVLRWDAPMMSALARRGAVFPDYPAEIDRYLETVESRPPEHIARDLARFRRFYFNDNPDPVRENRLRQSLGRPGTGLGGGASSQ